MTKMLIKGGYYSWPELIDFFLKNLQRAEKKKEDASQEEIEKELSLAENSIEPLASLVIVYSKPLEDEEIYFH
jgi:hypothetical protein